MLKRFICPDKEEISCESCITKCRRGERCLPLPYLVAVSGNRKYNGKVSSSQALNGVRKMYLDIVMDYAADPLEYVAVTLGTGFHEIMENNGTSGEYMETESLSGTFDYYDEVEQCLWDFKTYKAYKVMLVKGITQKKVPDPAGEVYQKSGKLKDGTTFKAGDIKLVSERQENEEDRDCLSETLQMNAYRIMWEAKGKKVKKMKLCMLVKNHEKNMIINPIEIAEIPFVENSVVEQFFAEKTELLNKHLASKTLPPICSPAERWGGNKKCKEFCKHYEICKIELSDEDLY